MNKAIQPKPVKKIVCPKCGELQVKIYPWSSYQIEAQVYSECQKCFKKKVH